MPTNLGNSAVATGLEKVSFHSNPKERQCQKLFKLLHNCTHLTCWHSNVKSSKPDFNSTWTVNLQMFKLDLEKAEEPGIKLPTSIGSSHQESKRVSGKHLQIGRAHVLNSIQFLWRQVRWSSIPISLRIFHSLLWSTKSKAQSMKQK